MIQNTMSLYFYKFKYLQNINFIIYKLFRKLKQKGNKGPLSYCLLFVFKHQRFEDWG